jgi:hypothetical protein
LVATIPIPQKAHDCNNFDTEKTMSPWIVTLQKIADLRALNVNSQGNADTWEISKIQKLTIVAKIL